MSTFAEVLTGLLAGRPARRDGWRNKFSIHLVTGATEVPFLARFPDGASQPLAPWPVTEDDMFSDDWIGDDSVYLPVLPSTFAYVLGLSATVPRFAVNGWPAGMYVERMSGPDRFELVLPNADRKPWRPAPQDLVANWGAVPVPEIDPAVAQAQLVHDACH